MVDERCSKRSLLKLSIDFECEDCEWDSDYGNHQSAIVIVFDLYKGHRGVIFQQKLRGIQGRSSLKV